MKCMGIVLMLAAAVTSLADSAFVDFELGLIYPKKLGGMTFDRVENYTNKEMGYSVFYALDDKLSAEISVFDLGRKSVETGHKVDGIDVIFQGVENLHERQEKNKEIAKVRKRGSTEIPRKGDIRFMNNVYQYSEKREVNGKPTAVTRIQSVYITAAHNNFFRTDLLFDIGNNTVARDATEPMVRELIGIIKAGHSKEELLLAACDALIHDPSGYGGRLAARHVLEKVQTLQEIEVYAAFFVWSEQDQWQKPENFELLEAAYYAGMIRFIVPKKLGAGGDFEAFSAMVDAYKVMRSKDQVKEIAELEKWAAATDRKAAYKQQLIDFNYVMP